MLFSKPIDSLAADGAKWYSPPRDRLGGLYDGEGEISAASRPRGDRGAWREEDPGGRSNI